MMTLKLAPLALILAFSSLFFTKEGKACHAIALVNITQQTPIAGGIILNAASDSPTCGCAPYWLDMEIRCIGEAFNAASFSPGFYGPLGTYPFYQSAQMNKPSCVVQNYPGITVSFAPLCPGTTYQYRMRENHNFSVGPWCATQTFVVPGIMPTFTATVVASANNICAGACSTITASPTGGCQIAVLYNWSTGATTSSITVCPAVTTTYTCAITDDCSNQVANVSMTIVVLPAPVAGTASVSPGAVCSGTPVNLTLTGSAGTIQWQSAPTTGGPWTNIAGATAATFTTAGMTSNTCFHAVVSGCGTPVTSNNVCITINPPPTVTVNSPTICPGGTATLTAAGATSYSWSTGAVINPITVSPSVTTTYTVTGSTAGCTGTAVATVTVTAPPTVTVNSPTICAGAIATLTGAGATSYSWSTGAAINPITVSPTSTTSYTVTGTAAGCTNTAVSTVTVTPLPLITVNSPTICPGQSATLTAAGGATYLWSTGSTANPITVTPGGTTSYTVTGTSSGCSATAVSNVTVGGSITITVNTPTICNGQSAILTAVGGATYSWSTGSTANPITVSPTTTTSYTVTGTTAGCTGSAVTTITVNPIPATTSTSTTICDGAVATITAGGATTYLWDTGSSANPLSVSPTTTTSYTVTGTSLGCTSTAIGTVTVNPIPVTTVNSPAICPSTTANLIAGGATTYTWSAGATASGVNTADAAPTATTTYTVTGTSLGCSSTAVATVTVNAALVVNAGANDTVCFGASTILGVSPSGAGYTYSWTPAASLTGAATATPTATPAATTTYTVLLTDPSGCTGTSSVTIYADPQITMAVAGIDVTCNSACNGQTIVIPGGGTPAYTYSWTSGCVAASCNALCPGTYT
ncbi:MAG: hypothetical protein H0X46_00425, partial [Bacteroidetes bacterium]|nr:hypothetical protein [Bacteroidota bacterium]